MRNDLSKVQAWLDYYTHVVNTEDDPLEAFPVDRSIRWLRERANQAMRESQADVDRIRVQLAQLM